MHEVTQPWLIGYGGLKGSGKDTSADFLVENRGFVKEFMSEPLHQALLIENPWIPLRMHLGQYHTTRIDMTSIRYSDLVDQVGYTKAKENPEVRRLLQRKGTEAGRHLIHEDVWVNVALKKIQSRRASGNAVCITGIRYPNELAMVRDNGGLLVWVDRPSVTRAASLNQDAHTSENTLSADDFDVVLSNSQDVAHLHWLTDALLDGLEARTKQLT